MEGELYSVVSYAIGDIICEEYYRVKRTQSIETDNFWKWLERIERFGI